MAEDRFSFNPGCRISRIRPANARSRLSAVATILAASLLAACTLVPPAPQPERLSTLLDDPAGDAALDAPSGRIEPARWWEAFNDPALDRVVEAVLESNFDLAEAVARVEQARIRAGIAIGARLPSISASLAADAYDVPANAALGAQLEELGIGQETFDAFKLTFPERLDLTTYTLGANFSYELDFWGRNRNDARAARAETLAAEADFRTARIGILAETAGTYFEVVDLRSQRGLTAETVGILEEQEALDTVRYERGLIDIGELYASRRQLIDAQTRLPRIEGRLADVEGRLWILLGGYREDLESVLPDALAAAAPLDPVPAGVPADLLMQRPDVGAARERVEAARHALGARRAELLPSLSIAGSIGGMSTESDGWFDADQWFRNLTVNLLGPVFERGRLRGNVALAGARLEETAAAYGRAVVTAVNEVRATLAGLAASQLAVARLTTVTEEAAAEAALQERRYVSGVADYATYLAAARNHVSLQSALAAGRRDLGFARLALHRALGGAWTANGPTAREPTGTATTEKPARAAATGASAGAAKSGESARRGATVRGFDATARNRTEAAPGKGPRLVSATSE